MMASAPPARTGVRRSCPDLGSPDQGRVPANARPTAARGGAPELSYHQRIRTLLRSMSIRVLPRDAVTAAESTALPRPDLAGAATPRCHGIRTRGGRLLPLAAALGTMLALLVLVAPADAARRTVNDATGDAPARLDITRFTVR